MMETLLSFFDKGDHGAYVWSAWGLALAILGIMAVAPLLRWRVFKTRADAARQLTAEHEQSDQGATDASA